jgi:hypothetical protein
MNLEQTEEGSGRSNGGGGDFASRLGTRDHGVELGAEIYGAELGAMLHGTEVPATSASCLTGGWDLGAMAHDDEMCYLSAMSHSADPQGPNSGIRSLGV